MKIVFNEQQNEAVRQIVEWFGSFDRLGEPERPIYFLAGWAGTGKTSVAQFAAESCVGPNQVSMIEYIAPTGKAAARLRQKGCKNARTMHQFIYRLRGEDEETGEPIFAAKEGLDYKPKLIVVDECSMLSEWDVKNLLSHGIPILAIGDPGQLPPVNAAQSFRKGHEDFLLDKIERQGGESNIIRASMFVRQGKQLPWREFEDVRVREGNAPLDQLIAHAGEDSQILCSFNNTRITTNNKMRVALGFSGDVPMIGEKIVCTFNQHGFGIMNGEQGIVLGYEQVQVEQEEDDDFVYQNDDPDADEGHRVRIKSLTDGKERLCRFDFRAFSQDPEVKKDAQKKAGGFDFGYVLTVHKSQGSEWPNVLVIEENMRGIPYAQLMYTAVTRAQNVLTIYRR